jgi:hypothetical protein
MKAKEDLLALGESHRVRRFYFDSLRNNVKLHLTGIDLDDGLIARLQSNLGIERIFEVARRSASLIKDKAKPPHILYSNVRHGPDNNSSFQSVSQTVKKHDTRLSTSILKDLDNRDSATVPPQSRPALDKLIESLAVLFAQSPERFVSCMMGRKFKPSDKVDRNFIDRLIVKVRYVNEDNFLTMVRRINPDVSGALSSSLFRLLTEDQGTSSSASNKKNQVVDLWAFFTLLQTASERSRRSFDGRTSKMASDVLFWKRQNNDSNQSLISSTVSAVSNKSFTSTTAREESTVMMTERNKRFNPELNSTTTSTIDGSKKAGLRLPVNPPSTVAELMGVPRLKHPSELNQGRSIKGFINQEHSNRGDISTVLHSPSKPLSITPNRCRVSRLSSNGRPNRSQDDDSMMIINNSDRMGSLLDPSVGRSTRPHSVHHTIRRETVSNNRFSVADLLRGGGVLSNESSADNAVGSDRPRHTLGSVWRSQQSMSVADCMNARTAFTDLHIV